jgi:hypothetical protein
VNADGYRFAIERSGDPDNRNALLDKGFQAFILCFRPRRPVCAHAASELLEGGQTALNPTGLGRFHRLLDEHPWRVLALRPFKGPHLGMQYSQ